MQVFRRIFFSRWQLWPCVQSVAPVVGRVSDRGWDGAGSNMRTQSLACQSWQQAKTHIAWHQWAQTCHTSKRPIFDHLVAHACISRAANKDINKDPQGMRQCQAKLHALQVSMAWPLQGSAEADERTRTRSQGRGWRPGSTTLSRRVLLGIIVSSLQREPYYRTTLQGLV